MVQETRFMHYVSKGSRFNQIYIPKEFEEGFDVGDKVEVRLIEKSRKLYYSKNIERLSKFKEEIIKEIFKAVEKFSVSQVFVFGSFLTKKLDYNDIDILVIADKRDKKLEGVIFNELSENINFKFHVLLIDSKRFSDLLEICPLTRSMMHYYVSNKGFEWLSRIRVDRDHLRFLMMMPEDLLRIRVESRIYYDSLRRLGSIEMFLKGREIDPLKIDEGVRKLVGESIYDLINKNGVLSKDLERKLRKLIKSSLLYIQRILKDGEKR